MSQVSRRNPKRKAREVSESIETTTTRPRSIKKKAAESSTPIADRSRKGRKEEDSLAKGDSSEIVPDTGESSSLQLEVDLELGADSTSREDSRGGVPGAAGDGVFSDEDDEESPASDHQSAVVPEVVKKNKGCEWVGGSYLGFVNLLVAVTFSAVIMKKFQLGWLKNQWSMDGDEAFAAKTTVVIFLMFLYGFVGWMDKILTTFKLLFRIYWPEKHEKIATFAQNLTFLFRMNCAYKVFVLPVSTFYGIKYWNMVWQRYICKSRYDRSCHQTALGLLLSKYRKEGCYGEDGRYSIMCDRMVSILPIFSLCLLATMIGTILQSIFNDRLGRFIYNTSQNQQQQQKESTTEVGDVTNDQSHGFNTGFVSDPDEDEAETETLSETNTEQIISDSE